MSGIIYAVFTTTHETMRAEKFLKQAGIKFRTAIKPRSLGGSCQMALSFAPDSLNRIISLATANGLGLVGFFIEKNGGWEKLSTANPAQS
ncbi:MAG: DUF3343 domain-containing protein [Nitrospinae bacterium]|nr:DUF3343 domain-containing protein [Nitrospinota bacterium]